MANKDAYVIMNHRVHRVTHGFISPFGRRYIPIVEEEKFLQRQVHLLKLQRERQEELKRLAVERQERIEDTRTNGVEFQKYNLSFVSNWYSCRTELGNHATLHIRTSDGFSHGKLSRDSGKLLCNKKLKTLDHHDVKDGVDIIADNKIWRGHICKQCLKVYDKVFCCANKSELLNDGPSA